MIFYYFDNSNTNTQVGPNNTVISSMRFSNFSHQLIPRGSMESSTQLGISFTYHLWNS